MALGLKYLGFTKYIKLYMVQIRIEKYWMINMFLVSVILNSNILSNIYFRFNQILWWKGNKQEKISN